LPDYTQFFIVPASFDSSFMVSYWSNEALLELLRLETMLCALDVLMTFSFSRVDSLTGVGSCANSIRLILNDWTGRPVMWIRRLTLRKF